MLTLFGELSKPATVVLFAGAGGSCTGLRNALGVSPLAAVNHCDHAIRVHALNHPETQHYRGDVWDIEPRQAVRGRKLDLLWLSPDCTHHSRARGGRPREHGRRALADVVFPWITDTSPRIIMLENVPEFTGWGPIDDKGQPIKSLSGAYFRAWVARLESYGYAVEWRTLRACDYGVPTSRERLYLIARRDGGAIQWPTATHGPGRIAYHTAAECIDWSIPWSRSLTADPLSPSSMRKVQVGRSIYGERPFLTVYYGTGTCASLDAPLLTVTTHDRFGLCQGDQYRMLHPRELARAMGFPDSYILTGPRSEQVARIGNAVCPPMAEALVRANMM